MTHVLLVDDHHATRAGLVALLRQEPGFVPVATAATAQAALEQLRTRPVDVALVDYHLPDVTGVDLCRQLRDGPPIVLYTAVPNDRLLVAARVAGAAGVLSKADPVEDVFDALRQAAKGQSVFPRLGRDALAAAAARLSGDELPILGMALDRTPVTEMASALQIDVDELERRMARVIAAVSPGSPRVV